MTSVYRPSRPRTKSVSAARFLFKGIPKSARHDDVPERSPSPALLPIGAKRPSFPYGASSDLRARRREGRIYDSPSSSRSSFESIGVTEPDSWSPPSLSPTSSYPTPIIITFPNSKSSSIQQGMKPKPKRPALELSHEGLPTPSSASVALLRTDFPPSPLSPTFSNVLSPDARVRKMAKLTRTLGENIPPELVFPPPSCVDKKFAHASSSRQNRRRSMSVGAIMAVSSSDAFSLPAKSPAGTPPSKAHAAAAAAVPQSPPPFSDASFESSPPLPSMSGSRLREVEMWRRKEREWSGEWNVQDYEHVLRGLRGLKTRK